MKRTIILLSVVLFAISINAQVNYNNNTTNGSYASALGENNSADGPASFVGGINSSADGGYSFAFGNTAQSLSPHSVALGAMTTANGSSSFALGKFCKADGASAFVIGSGQSSSNIFTNSTHHSLMVGFNSDLSTLFVGGSIGLGYTGKIGIGDVTDPHAKLHIKADNNEYVDLLLEPGGSTKKAVIKFGEISLNNSPNRIEAKQTGDLDFYTASDYVFRDGDVGIGVINPLEKLEVDGTVKSTGLMLNNGTQAAGKILQSDETGLASWVDPMSINDGDWETNGNDIYNMNSGNVGIGVDNPIFNLHIKKSATLGLQNENANTSGEIASITAGDANNPNMARIIFNNGGYNGESSQIAFYTSEEYTGTLHKAITISESKRLTCFGDAFFKEGITLEGNVSLNGYWIKTNNITSGGIYLDNQNKVGIGTDTPGAALDVAGRIICNEVEVNSLDGWKDYVFDTDYDLASIEDVETFIAKNGHLPEIPSEADVLENGYNLGEMDALLLQKIEELTLYVIDLKKEINELKSK